MHEEFFFSDLSSKSPDGIRSETKVKLSSSNIHLSRLVHLRQILYNIAKRSH
jgi:hypothetical protein